MKIILTNTKLVFETVLPRTQIEFYNNGYISRKSSDGTIGSISTSSPRGWLSMPININNLTQLVIESLYMTTSGFAISFYTEKPFDSFSDEDINVKLKQYGNPIINTSIVVDGFVANATYMLADAKAAGAKYAIISAYVTSDPRSQPNVYVQ